MILLALGMIWPLYDTPLNAVNAGRRCILEGDLPRAILIYRMALSVYPSNRALQQDLQEARNLVEYPRPDLRPPGFTGWRHRFLPVLFFIAFSGGLAISALGAYRWFTTRPGWAAVLLGFGTAIAFTAGLTAMVHAIARDRDLGAEIGVIRLPVTLRIGNGDSFPAAIPDRVVAGQELLVIGHRGNWVHIQLPDGQYGWVPETDIWIGMRP